MAASKILVNGVELYYKTKGNGSHAIVCIPGALGTTEAFVDQFDYYGSRCGGEFTIITFDPRGFGKSRPPQREFTLDFHTRDAKDTKGLMDVLGIKQFSVFGWSDGAMIGIIVASLYPESVRKLIIWGGNTFVGEEDKKLYIKYKDISLLDAATREKKYQFMVKSVQLPTGVSGSIQI